MKDQTKWNLGVSKLTGMVQYGRSPYRENDVADYHQVIELLQEGSGEDLSHFKISAERMRREVTGVQPATDWGPGRTFYADHSTCEPTYFKSQVGGLGNYVQLVTARNTRPAVAKIPAAASTAPQIHIENMHNSSLMHQSPGGTINQHFEMTSPEFKEFVQSLRANLPKVQLPPSDRAQAEADLTTVESQLAAPKPKSNVIRESLMSLKTALEIAIGDVVAGGMLTGIHHFLK